MNELEHIGVKRRSGRYPWGSGDEPYQGGSDFLDTVAGLKKVGVADRDIHKHLGMSVAQYRDQKTIHLAERNAADLAFIYRLKEKGVSTSEIARRMDKPEPTVRAMVKRAERVKVDMISGTAGAIKSRIEETDGFVDVGAGVERQLGISKEKLRTAVQTLQGEGYSKIQTSFTQIGTGEETRMIVVGKPGTTWKDVKNNSDKIVQLDKSSTDGGLTFADTPPPKSVSSKRLLVRYGEDGGGEMDGVIEIRRGVPDLALGTKNYAQVRIAVDDSHYLKGMAVYADDIPAGYDMRFNTPKANTGKKLDALKKLEDDPVYPFKTIVEPPREYVDAKGKRQQSSINVVNDEGNWDKWSRTLSSQMLSKQNSALAKAQLAEAHARKRAELDEILSMNNPVVKKKMLLSFSEDADAAAVDLKAAALPRQATRVILPVKSMKEGEVYAPHFNHGEKVVLIRHPHAGPFEIPELTVNNRNREARKMIPPDSKDAIGINFKTAKKLSGADFDGDTVLVIPNNRTGKLPLVKTAPTPAKLKNFDPQAAYPYYEGMKTLTPDRKQKLMGEVSNLISDMTIKGASTDEIVRAVKHSMVVIDAEKHKLNYKQSEIDNGIKALKTRYQGGPTAGASTLITLAKSRVDVPDRKLRLSSEGGNIDPKTGELKYVPTGKTKDVLVKGEWVKVPKTIESKKMAETTDAFTLSKGSTMEAVYAAHANKLKGMANEARKATLSIKGTPESPTAKKIYAPEIKSLEQKLNQALLNAPKERQAQLIARVKYDQVKKANPDWDKDKLKKVRNNLLARARTELGAHKDLITITPKEWEAVQSGGISNHKLTEIIRHTDEKALKALATPRTTTGLSPNQKARARNMAKLGYTVAEVATALGVSASTLNKEL